MMGARVEVGVGAGVKVGMGGDEVGSEGGC